MARATDCDAIYAAADRFRERCLMQSRSLLWPDAAAWTVENINALWAAFVDNPDDGKRSFMDKWHDQIASESSDVHRIAADTIALYFLFPNQIGMDAKLNAVQQVVDWRLGSEGDPPEMPLLRAAFRRGVGNTGPYYSTGRPWQIAFYLDFARSVIGGEVDPNDPAACRTLERVMHLS